MAEEWESNQAAVAEQGERRASKCGCFGKLGQRVKRRGHAT